MKRTTLFILLLIPFLSFSQLSYNLKAVINKKIDLMPSLPEDTEVELKEIFKDEYNTNKVLVIYKGNRVQFDLKQIDRLTFKPSDLKEFWQGQIIQNSMTENILKNGYQYKLRKDLEDDAVDYISLLETNDFFFEDSYLESYINSLLYRLFPNENIIERTGIKNIRILKDLSPNVIILPNGTVLISSGMLSAINSEEELMAVLAIEISKFVLDHSLINIQKSYQRQKRTEFWSAFATGVTSTFSFNPLKNLSYYSNSSFTINSSTLINSIATSVSDRLGLNFSKEQILAADKCANELLKFINVDSNALSTALSHIQQYCIESGNFLALSVDGLHPYIGERIKKNGTPSSYNLIEYNKKVSFVNTFNSIQESNNLRYYNSAKLANRNVIANIASDEDYVLLATANIYTYNTLEKNTEALEMINKAKILSVSPTLNTFKQEAIVLIRLKKYEEAKKSIEKYIERLTNEIITLEKTKDENDIKHLNTYISKEIDWSTKMVTKITKL